MSTTRTSFARQLPGGRAYILEERLLLYKRHISDGAILHLLHAMAHLRAGAGRFSDVWDFGSFYPAGACRGAFSSSYYMS